MRSVGLFCWRRSKDMWLPDEIRPSAPVSTPVDVDAFDRTVLAPRLFGPQGDAEASARLRELQDLRGGFICGAVEASALVAGLGELLARSSAASSAAPPSSAEGGLKLVAGTKRGPCEAIVLVMHSLGGDWERESVLHAAYLRRFPDCYSVCCKRRHCFRCHIREFHQGLTCEQYQLSQAKVEDVVPCPGCGLQLTKGDGCSSVKCVCGKAFNWAEELRKVRVGLAGLFEAEAREASGLSADARVPGTAVVEAAARRAALVSFHATPEHPAVPGTGSPATASPPAADVPLDEVSVLRANAWKVLHPTQFTEGRKAIFQAMVSR